MDLSQSAELLRVFGICGFQQASIIVPISFPIALSWAISGGNFSREVAFGGLNPQ